MNEDDQQQQDGDQSVLMEQIDSAQKMLDNLKNLLAKNTEKEKDAENKVGADGILTSLKKRIQTICGDAESKLGAPGPSTTSDCVENGPAEPTEPHTDAQLEIKQEIDENLCKVGSIKVRNLSFLLDPNKNKVNEDDALIVLSDSDDEPMEANKHSDKTKTVTTKPAATKISSSIEKPQKKKTLARPKSKRTVVVPESSSDSSSDSSPDDEIAFRKSAESMENETVSFVLNTDDALPSSSASPSKSILKSPHNNCKSPDKKVQFSPSDAVVHTYANNLPSSSESSCHDDTSSDDDYTIKTSTTSTAKKKQLRPRNVNAKQQDVHVDEQIRQDNKYFRKCVVNVQRFSTDKLLKLCVKGKEDDFRTDETKRMRNMDGLKRKRSTRSDTDLSSDVDVKQKDKKQKKEEKKREKEERKHKREERRQRKEEKKQLKKLNLTNEDEEDASDEEKLGSKLQKLATNNGVSSKKSKKKHEPVASPTDEEQETLSNDKDKDLTDEDMEESAETNDLIGGEAEEVDNGKSNSAEEEEEEETMTSKKSKKNKKTKPKRVLSDSDDSASEHIADHDSESSQASEASDASEVETPKKPAPKKSNKRSRIKKVAEDSSDDDEKATRKQIRKVLSRDSLADTTKQAERDEAARKARIAERQKKYNDIFDADSLESSSLSKVVLDFNEETQEEILSVDKELVKHLKPHQGKGIQFMWDACFESIDRATNTEGSGCILAHCMGLGKTLQVITLIHTLLTSQDKTGVKKVLVVCPLSTVLNWVAEFKKWLPDDDEVQVYNLVAYKQNRERVCHVMDWHKYGGVLILGYDMFRNLSNDANKRVSKKMRNDFKTALVDPGPQLVVCDEGHLLKNEKTSISKAMNNVKTVRRIVLTGTPLQNNLKEYYCMVQFVKKNLLGTYKEYLNRFVNPITNGQYTDSTQMDIVVMRKRSHVLHKLLDGIVQRRDYAVLAPFLPPKHEYVIFISLTDTQINLYNHYMVNFAQKASGPRTSFLFTDFQELQRICTHPRVLLDKSIQNRIAQDKKDWDNEDWENDSEGSLKEFIDDSDGESEAKSTSSGSGSDDEDKANHSPNKPNKYRRRTRAMAENDSEPEPEEVAAPSSNEWWRQFTAGDELDNIIHSGKLTLLFEILHQCELIGDKILVFSQSLLSLNVIEYFLSRIDEAAQSGDDSLVRGYSSSWSLGLDYFRLDGSSSCDNRALWCKTFNDPNNTRARLFLISTKAGGLGINLVAANRVIIFDVSWNPSHDIQSIYRVYRFGQIKPSYIYRFVTLGTMEMKIYERQVTKQAISKRVIDEQQIDRHYNQNDLQELYKFEPKPEERPLPAPPKDILLGELLLNFNDLIFKYHEHQTLLENKEDEVLNEEERKAAWDEFENEKKIQKNSSGNINNIPMHTVVEALASIIKRERSTFTPFEINGVMPQLIAELRGQIANGEMALFNKVLAEIRTIKAAEQIRVQEYYKQQQALWMMQQMQRQFPGFNTADHAKLLRAQMQNMQFPGMNMGVSGGATTTTTATPNQSLNNLSNSNEVVNLEED